MVTELIKLVTSDRSDQTCDHCQIKLVTMVTDLIKLVTTVRSNL
jgi:hypothetical protein